MVTDKDCVEEWVMDSGCTFHMTPCKHFFSELNLFEGGKVIMGNNQQCFVKGIGSMTLRTSDGSLKILKDVRYVPELKRNLISLGTLDKAGFSYTSENGTLNVTKDSVLKLSGQLRDGLYILKGKTVTGELNVLSKLASKETFLWHRRLAHIGEKGLDCLYKQGLLGKAKPVYPCFCEHCALGKSMRASFRPASYTTIERLDYIHSDLWGPARVTTHGGARYFLTLIDDFSTKLWIFTLKSKDEVFERFLEWKTQIENKTGKKIKYLRTDNGLEYLNEKFINLCKSSGISRHLTVVGTPQQNGLAERFNRTLLERVRCMLSNSNLPRVFWGEAVNTTAYIISRSPSSALKFKTPQEVWTGKPPNLKHLRIFGCAAYAHTRQEKLQPHAKRCVFIGYPQGVKAYKLWSLEQGERRCIISRDVVFNENLMPWKNEYMTGTRKETETFEIELQATSSNAVQTDSGTAAETPSNTTEASDHEEQQETLEPADDLRDY